MDRIEQESDMRFKDQQSAMLMQESTIEFVIKALQKLKDGPRIKLDEELAQEIPFSNKKDYLHAQSEAALYSLKESIETKLKSSPKKLI